jgi:hypothetical protein
MEFSCSRSAHNNAQQHYSVFHCYTALSYTGIKQAILTLYSPVVTICTAQWSLYVPHSGHYMCRTVVTICAVQWSLYVPQSGHYMCRTAFTIRASQRSLYVPHSGHYMCRTAVTICAAQWSLYVPPVLTFSKSTFCPHSVFMCFVWI